MTGRPAHVTGAQALVAALAAEGVEVVFGLPGVHSMPIYDALYRHPGIRHIGVRHEQAAAFMADGYARSTGRVGVCLTTTGPGAANTVAALAESYSSSSPVLEITTQIASAVLDKNKGVLHDTRDQLGMFRAVTGWNKRVESFDDIPGTVHEAFSRMRSGRARPVVIEIPVDLLAEDGELAIAPPAEGTSPEAAEADISAAVEALAASQAPVIWAGGGAIAAGADGVLLELAELIGAPVMTTYKGKGAIPEDHPLSLGNWASSGEGRDMLQGLLDGADLTLAVGTRFSAVSTGDWSLRFPQPLVHVDIDAAEIGKNYHAQIGVVGDSRAVLEEILRRLRERGVVAGVSRVEEVAALRDAVREIVAASQPGRLEVVEALRSVLPRDAILVCDMTMVAYLASRHFRAYQPRGFLYPAGFGTLGYAFPAALGARVAWPERPVVAVCGDGGFVMGCQELATAVEHGICLPVLVFNDGGYGVLRLMQDFRYDGRRIGVDLHAPDFVALAKAFGADGLKVTTLEDLGPALERALAADGPTVIEVTGALMASLS